MPKIIKVNSCGECPYIGIEKQPPLKCLCAPSDNYGTVIDDILEIPAWCPLPEDDDRQELLAALEGLLAWVEDELRICESDAGAKARDAITKAKAARSCGGS